MFFPVINRVGWAIVGKSMSVYGKIFIIKFRECIISDKKTKYVIK